LRVLKTFIFFLSILSAFTVSAQTDSLQTVIQDERVINALDSINQIKIENDSIQSDSLQTDSILQEGISPDAVDQVIEYSSKDSILFSLSSEMMYLYGIGDISATEMSLQSAFVEISTGDSYLYSEAVPDSSGNSFIKPVLNQEDETFTVKSIKYNFKSKRAIVKDVKTEQEQGYLHSDVAKMQTNKEFHIHSGKFTTCDLDHPHFYIKLTKAKKIPDKNVISGPMYFVIADIPLYFIGLPFGLLPNQKKNTSGILMPEYGEENNRGFFLRNGGYFLAVNDKINTSIVGDIYSRGSWGLTWSTNFKVRYRYSGNIELKYSRNKTIESVLEEFVSSKQSTNFWVNGVFNQDSKSNPNSTVSASLNFGSSGFRSENATDYNDFVNNQASSSLSYSWNKPGSIFNFNMSMRSNQNLSQKTVNLDLPNFSLNMKRQFPFKNIGVGSTNWYKKIGVSVNINAKNSINTYDSLLFTNRTLYEMQNGLKYTIPVSTSFNIFTYLTVSPSFSFTGRIYTESLRERNIITAEDGELQYDYTTDTIPGIYFPYDFNFSVPLSTKIFGQLNFKKGKLQAIRHVVSPSISFSYRPDFGREFWGFWGENIRQTSWNSFDTVQYSYYKSFIYGAPPQKNTGSINFSLGNNFEMKLKNKNDTAQESRKVKILDNLSFSASYDLVKDSLNLSNISMSGNTKLFKNFGLRFSGTFEPYMYKDTAKVPINKFRLIEEGKLARFTRGSVTLTGSLKPSEGESRGLNLLEPEDAFYYYQYPYIPYADFSVPWNLSVNYTLKIENDYIDKNLSVLDFTQTMTISGNVNLTKNWKINGNTSFDFSTRKFSYAQFSVYRDLHCWEMSFNVQPFGSLKGYSFRINIKSSVFKGVEYNKRKGGRDNFFGG
jgi:hypothetical protein